MYDPHHKGGFNGPRDHHRESNVSPKFRQWDLFAPAPMLDLWDQMELIFPVDTKEIP